MAAKGSFVKLHTGDGTWVPAIVTSDTNADGKCFVTAFPGPNKDSKSLDSPACEIEAGPGTGEYEFTT